MFPTAAKKDGDGSPSSSSSEQGESRQQPPKRKSSRRSKKNTKNSAAAAAKPSEKDKKDPAKYGSNGIDLLGQDRSSDPILVQSIGTRDGMAKILA